MLPDPRRPPLALQRGAESCVNRHELACFRLFLCPSAVLKLLKMAKGMRALLDTVMQALPQVNAGPAGGGASPRQRGAKTEASLDRGRPLKDLCAPAEYLTGLLSDKHRDPEMSHSLLFLPLCSTPDRHMNGVSVSQRKKEKKQGRKTVFVLEGLRAASRIWEEVKTPAKCAAVLFLLPGLLFRGKEPLHNTCSDNDRSRATRRVSDSSSRWIEPLPVTVRAAFFWGGGKVQRSVYPSVSLRRWEISVFSSCCSSSSMPRWEWSSLAN